MEHIEAIERLAKLRADGALTEAEFQAAKEKVLAGGSAPAVDAVTRPPQPSNPASALTLVNAWWFQCLLLFFLGPIGIAVMLLVPAYRRINGEDVRVPRWFKAVGIVIATLLWLLTLARLVASNSPRTAAAPAPANTVQTVAIPTPAPADAASGQQAAAPPAPPSPVPPAATALSLPLCDSTEAVDALKAAAADSPEGRAGLLELHELKDAREADYEFIGMQRSDDMRVCTANAFYNTGLVGITYTMQWLNKADGTWFVQSRQIQYGEIYNR